MQARSARGVLLLLFAFFPFFSLRVFGIPQDWDAAQCGGAYQSFSGDPKEREETILGTLSPGQREAVERLRDLVTTYHETFAARVENYDDAPKKKERRALAEKTVRQASLSLQLLGVTNLVRKNKNGELELVILPSNGTALGRLAAGVKKYDGVEMVFNPENLLRDLDEGSYDEGTRQLHLSIDSILSVDPDTGMIRSLARPTLIELHELRHMAEARRKAHGETGIFALSLSPQQGREIPGAGPYGDNIWGDEAATHPLEEYARFREYRQMRHELESPGALADPARVERLRGILTQLAKESAISQKEKVPQKVTRVLKESSLAAVEILKRVDRTPMKLRVSGKGKLATLYERTPDEGFDFIIEPGGAGKVPLVEITFWTSKKVAMDVMIADAPAVRDLQKVLAGDLPAAEAKERLKGLLTRYAQPRLTRFSGLVSEQLASYNDLQDLLATAPERLHSLARLDPADRNGAEEELRQRLLRGMDALERLGRNRPR